MSLTEDQIRAAYGRLDDALSPPVDAVDRVGRRIAVRRHRRRAALAGAGLAVVAVVFGGVLVGGDREDRDVATDGPGPGSTLVLTRPDGSTYSFDEVSVSCSSPGAEGGVIRLASPFRLSDEGGAEERLEVPFLLFEGDPERLVVGETVTLGSPSSGGAEGETFTLFVADSEGGPDGNEVSSAQAGTTGTLTVVEAGCDPTPVLRLRVDATLGSEEEKGTLALAGEVG